MAKIDFDRSKKLQLLRTFFVITKLSSFYELLLRMKVDIARFQKAGEFKITQIRSSFPELLKLKKKV